jgi:hypothetical protein
MDYSRAQNTQEAQMQRVQNIATSLVIAVFSSAACYAIPTERPSPSSVGEWTLCEDPDDSPRDTLQFYREGYGFLVRSDRPNVPFLFAESESHVVTLFSNARGQVLLIKYEFADGKKRMNLYSERTKHWSYYVRVERVADYSCTSK